MAENVGPSTRKKMEGLAEGKGIPVSEFRGRRPLEAVTGKVNCRVLGVLDGNFARKILEALKNERTCGIDG
jgi:ribosomal protein L7Ae-like RNA K-turn-binding protein